MCKKVTFDYFKKILSKPFIIREIPTLYKQLKNIYHFKVGSSGHIYSHQALSVLRADLCLERNIFLTLTSVRPWPNHCAVKYESKSMVAPKM